MKSFLNILVISLWIVMMASLLLKEGVLFAPKIKTITYKDILEEGIPFREDWVGVYLQKRKIGYACSIISPYKKEGVTGLLICYHGLLSLLPREYQFNIQGYTFIDSDYHLMELFLNLTSGFYKARIHGKKAKEDLHLKILLNDKEFEEVLPLSKTDCYISPIFCLPRLKENRLYLIEFFDPLKMGYNRARLKVKRSKEDTKAMMAEVRLNNEVYSLLIGEDGRILKLRSSIGLMLLSEEEDEAKRGVIY